MPMFSSKSIIVLALTFRSIIHFLKKIYYLFIYFRLRRVLVVAHGIFVAVCRLFVAVHGFLSSCGVRVFSL